jgi:hypothetical protein
MEKELKEYEFSTIPIWLRMFGLPVGMMDCDTGELIGDDIGEFMEADVGDDGMARGQFLRVKVRINIKKPLMRGIMLNVEEGKPGVWSRFEYEFLPDFCYRCGMLDHIDRDCKVTLGKGEKAQFGSWHKAYIPRQTNEQFRGLGEGRHPSGDGRGNGYNRRFGFNSLSGRSGSESANWRNNTEQNREISNVEKEKEVAFPQKTNTEKVHADVERNNMKQKQLLLGGMNKVVEAKYTDVALGGVDATLGVHEVEPATTAAPLLADATAMHVDQVGTTETCLMDNETKGEVAGIEGKNKEARGKFRRLKKSERSNTADISKNFGIKLKDKKRGFEEEEVDMASDQNKKRTKVGFTDVATNTSDAGLSKQPCETQ